MKLLMMMRNAWREELTGSLKWEPHGVGLDRAPCGVVEADDSTPRANPDHGSRSNEKYLEMMLSGKR